MTALLIIGAILAFILFTIVRSPILRTLFTLLLLPLLFGSRSQRQTDGSGDTVMDSDEARRILDVGPYATHDEIVAAHHRLMKQLHPDRGGSAYFATRINVARDTLLKTAGVTIENPPQ